MTAKPMKFICLHGAIGSPGNLKTQFWPVGRHLDADGTAKFVFTKGAHRVVPPKGFEDYFGKGPWYRYVLDEEFAENAMLNRIRELPPAETPEETLKTLVPPDFQPKDPKSAFAQLDKVLEEHPDAEGILGYSEGAAMSASYILYEKERFEKFGIPRKLKCGVFFTGWPAATSDGWPIFSDEKDIRIDVPSIHVVGANDPFLHGALALYNICDPEQALLFDTGKGHTLPRDGPVLQELADAMRKMVADVRQQQ